MRENEIGARFWVREKVRRHFPEEITSKLKPEA